MLAQASRGLDALSVRLSELDREVSSDQASVAVSATAAVGFAVAAVATRKKGFLALAGLGAGLVVAQFVSKRSPFGALAARLGLRDGRAIDLEKRAIRYALVALGRGSA